MTQTRNEVPFISVVVATYERPILLRQCLESILNGTYKNFEVIVVGQGEDRSPERVLRENFINNTMLKVIRTDGVGLSHARNIGSRHAQGVVVVYIDDDARASSGWLDGYAETFSNPSLRAGMVGGKVDPDWEVPRPEWYPAEREFLLGLYDIGDQLRPFPDKDLPFGANCAVLKSIFAAVGGFDERMGFNMKRKHSMISGEDSLLALRIKEAGYPLYYQPKAKVVHLVRAAKLTRRYFLRRHYWEGVTQMRLTDCKDLSDRRNMAGNFYWHLKRVLKGACALTGDVVLLRGPQSHRMLKLAEIAYSLGICAEASRFLATRRPAP